MAAIPSRKTHAPRRKRVRQKHPRSQSSGVFNPADNPAGNTGGDRANLERSAAEKKSCSVGAPPFGSFVAASCATIAIERQILSRPVRYRETSVDSAVAFRRFDALPMRRSFSNRLPARHSYLEVQLRPGECWDEDGGSVAAFLLFGVPSRDR